MGHSRNIWNEIADYLAKRGALGEISPNIWQDIHTTEQEREWIENGKRAARVTESGLERDEHGTPLLKDLNKPLTHNYNLTPPQTPPRSPRAPLIANLMSNSPPRLNYVHTREDSPPQHRAAVILHKTTDTSTRRR